MNNDAENTIMSTITSLLLVHISYFSPLSYFITKRQNLTHFNNSFRCPPQQLGGEHKRSAIEAVAKRVQTFGS